MAETNAFAEAVRKMTPHVETDDSGIWLMDGETPLMEVRPEQIMHTEAHYLLDEMCRAVVTVRQQQDARTESLRRVREALQSAHRSLTHREDRSEVCYDWCPLCRVDAALSELAAVEQQMADLEQANRMARDVAEQMEARANKAAADVRAWHEAHDEREAKVQQYADIAREQQVRAHNAESRVAELEADKARLESATEFTFWIGQRFVLIRKCFGSRLPKEPMWKVVNEGGFVLTKEGLWEHEPQPSSRDDAFYARARYNTYEEARAAIDAAREGR